MPTYVDTIVAEDFRQELGNKITLNGVLGEEIYLPQIPIALPSLIFLQRWRVSAQEIDSGLGQVSFGVGSPDGRLDRFPPPPPPSFQRGITVTLVNFMLKFVGFPIRLRGEHTFRTFMNDVEMHSYKFYVYPLAEWQAAQTARPRTVGFSQP